MKNPGNNPLKKPEEIEGRYANCFQIGQNEFEILIDFGQSYGDKGEGGFYTRIVCNPFYANVLLELLKTSIKSYEDAFEGLGKGV
ncbi:MAG: DUF3467 domain-containing protein [Planctomycetes bacterium]|nr:DUF3467 domain-containing protein [Planctomycetota bacterium]